MKKNYIQCDSLEELKINYKTLKNLRKSIRNDFKTISLKSNSWKNIWESIQELKALIKKDRIVYALTNLDNPDRSKIIGLSNLDLENENEFKNWKNKTVKIVHPDINNDSDINKKANQKLNEIIKERELLWQK